MKVLVTGSTGFIGQKLARELATSGYDVSVLTRDPEKAQKQVPDASNWFTWKNLENGALNGIDAVVHLAGESIAGGRWTEERKRRIRESRTKTTRLLIDAIKNSGSSGPRILVGVSAIGIYGDRGDEQLTESSSIGTGFLSEVCREWEELTRSLESTLRVVVLRLGMVLGHGGGALSRLVPVFSMGVGGRVGSGKQWVSWVHIDDVVQTFIWSLANQNARGVYNVTAPQPVRNQEFAKQLGHALHRPAVLPAPAFALKLALGEMAEIVLDSQNVMPARLTEEGYAFHYRSLEVALAQLFPN